MANTFKKGMRAVRIIDVKGSETASIVTITKVTNGRASIEDSSWQLYSAETGRSLDDPLPGVASRLVLLEE